MPFPGLAGPLAPQGPLGAPRGLTSPNLFGLAQTPASRTVLASPIADRLAGPLMQAQRMAQFEQVAHSLRAGLKLLASQVIDQDPRRAAALEQMAANLLKLMPPPQQGPTNPGGLMRMAQGLPTAAGSVPAVPPPPVGGTSPLSGLPEGSL